MIALRGLFNKMTIRSSMLASTR